MRWHFLRTAPATGAHNMALDEALMRRAARTGDAVFRVYGWSAPTLSLGRNQRARDCYDEAAARDLGVTFVRRPTGGRALLHHREVTYSVTMPAAGAAESRSAYAFINEVLLDGLARLGVGASRASGGGAITPGLRPCFDVPSEHEIVIGERKLVGSAQWNHDGALLQHGSILVQDDQAMIGRLLKAPLPPAAAATLADALGWEPGIDDLAPQMREALEAGTGAPTAAIGADTVSVAELEPLIRAYSDGTWTWRR